MKVNVRYNANFAETAGRHEEEFEIKAAVTIKDLLVKIKGKYGVTMDLFEEGTNDIKPHVWVFINGHSITNLQGLATKLKDADQLVLTPAVGGG